MTTEDGKIKSTKLINDFIVKFCNNKIENLKNFSFLNLNTNMKYHQPDYNIEIQDIKKYGGYFYNKTREKYTLHQWENDYDDMNLIRAINYLLYSSKENKLPGLKWDDFDWEYENFRPDYNEYMYRGETINTFQTLINEDAYKEYFKDISDSKNFIEYIDEFFYKIFTIVNFMLLPNKKVGSNSLNTYKGRCLGDYFDRFVLHILKGDNEFIEELLKANEFYFQRNNENFINDFITKNYLQDYIDTNNIVNINFAPYYKHQYFDNSSSVKDKELYANYIRDYIKVVSAKIDNRADMMIKDLKKYF